MLQAGGCLCSELRYETLAEPQRITFCHCRFCQRATGSAFMVRAFRPYGSGFRYGSAPKPLGVNWARHRRDPH